MKNNRNIKELYDIKGKVAIVTGGRTGIGYQLAIGLAEAGCNLAIADIMGAEKESSFLKNKYKIKTIPLKLDITLEEDVIRMVNHTLDYFNRLDILVNNAGGASISDTLATDLSEWDHIIDLNLTSVFLCCREAGRHMIKNQYGKIINIASVYGSKGIDPRNYILPENIKPGNSRESLSFSATKAAVINLTRDLAANWARYNITVNSISPGAFSTESTKKFINEYSMNKITNRIPMNRWGEGDDLKGVIVFLASDASKYVTGHNLVVDGGWTAWC